MKKKPIEILRRLYRERAKDPALTSVQSPANAENILSVLKRDGIIVLENYFSLDLCNEIAASIDAYISKNSALIPDVKQKVSGTKEYKFGVPMSDGTSFWVDKAESDMRIIHAELINERLKKDFFENEYFISIGESMLQKKLARNWTMANRTTYKENNLGSGGGWHRDNNYSHGFKALVYLKDVNENNGPFQYIKRSYTLNNHLFDFPYPDKYQFTETEMDNYIDKNKKLFFEVTGKAGSLVMFNTNGIHRGMPLKEGTRYAITNYYK